MDNQLRDIINGTMLGDAGITVTSGKYFNYRHIAKDRRYLEWQSKFLQKHKIKSFIGIANKISQTYHLGVYINSHKDDHLLGLHQKWYKRIGNRNVKVIPKDIKLNSTVLLHWYLGDGSLIRQESRVPRIVLATNSFSRQNIGLLIRKLRDLGLNFYPLLCCSGFKKSAESGYVLISKTSDETPFRFFNLIGIKCPEKIRECFTGNKGRGSKRHYFKDKWPCEEDWLRMLHNAPQMGKTLKERRKELDISQGQLAKKVNVGRNTIKRIERGTRYPSVPLFRKLLNSLEINSFYLLDKLAK